MADTNAPGGRLARIAMVLGELRRQGIRVSLTGGFAVDLLGGAVLHPHKDVDLLLPLEDLAPLTSALARRGMRGTPGPTGGMVVTELGYTDLLTAVHDAWGLWRPSWRPDGVPWPDGHPFQSVIHRHGYTFWVTDAADMLLRVLADFGSGSVRARTEGARLEALLAPDARGRVYAAVAAARHKACRTSRPAST